MEYDLLVTSFFIIVIPVFTAALAQLNLGLHLMMENRFIVKFLVTCGHMEYIKSKLA